MITIAISEVLTESWINVILTFELPIVTCRLD